jgi:hypothetical protein
MEDGKGARKSNNITATSIREARTTSKKQQSERKQELANKLRSAMKKNLTAYFGKGKRSPGPTTAGNPINPMPQIACRHSDGHGRQRSRSGREEGQQQQLAYTSREEEEGQEQYYTSGCGRRGGAE